MQGVDSNHCLPGYEPGGLPLAYPAIVETIFKHTHLTPSARRSTLAACRHQNALEYGHRRDHILAHSGIRTLRPALGLQTDPLAIGSECARI